MMLVDVLLIFILALSKGAQSFGSCSTGNQDAVSNIINNLYSNIQIGECKLVNNTKYKTYDPVDGEVFDFIIVGAGAAGSVLANRLSENPKWKILTIEAGKEPSLATEIPALFFNLQRTSEDWNYFSEPSDTCCRGMNDGKCCLSRGKVLGGSTSINGLLYLRGDPRDYNAWAAVGNTGWDYISIFPYFKNLTTMRAPEVLNSPDFNKYHATSGFLKVDTSYTGQVPPVLSDLNGYISKGFQDLGLNTYYDVNKGNIKPGWYTLQTTNDNGVRFSAAKAFIKSVEYRKNLHVSINSFATKLLIKNKKAYGVEFIKNGNRVKVKANLEVIVSAGAYNSPQLLMLSGIGPKEHLKELGIDVVQNSKVGQNLQDHLLVRGLLLSVNYPLPSPPMDDLMYQYLTTFTGTLSQLISFAGFIDTTGVNYPDLQLYLLPIVANNTDYIALDMHTSNINQTYHNSFFNAVRRSVLFETFVNLLRPKSRGKVLLRSTNPFDAPKIYLNTYIEKVDLRKTISGIRFIQNLCETKSMKQIGCSLVKMDILECSSHTYDTDEYWECHLRTLTSTIWHPVGTCKMAPRYDPSAVVDPELRVIGVENLRVVDASIMPTIVSSNTMVPTYMIAEKASDMIKKHWCPYGLKSCLGLNE